MNQGDSVALPNIQASTLLLFKLFTTNKASVFNKSAPRMRKRTAMPQQMLLDVAWAKSSLS